MIRQKCHRRVLMSAVLSVILIVALACDDQRLDPASQGTAQPQEVTTSPGPGTAEPSSATQSVGQAAILPTAAAESPGLAA